MSIEDILSRLVVLVKDDKELHDAIVNLINAMADRERALAEFRRAKAKRW